MPPSLQETKALPDSHAIEERTEDGVLVLHPREGGHRRRVLFINSYGGSEVWTKVKNGQLPPHHMWGCIELVRMGYEVAVSEPLYHFNYRRPFPHDLPLFRFARRWLRRDDVIYCCHTLLYWIPVLKALGLLRCHVVSLTYAREELDFARFHSGIIAMTPAALDQARRMAPQVQRAHISWGSDETFFPDLKYDGKWFLSCGITQRDFSTLSAAANLSRHPLKLVCSGIPKDISWPGHVEVVDGGSGWNHQKTVISYDALFHQYYAGVIASLIILKNDPEEYTAVGFTNLLEAMALGRPVIVTRTGAIPSEIDVEARGCGLFVPAENPAALRDAMETLASDPKLAEQMGQRGRELARKHYNIRRYADHLNAFFERL